MSKKAVTPDAWDDDWELQADKEDAVGTFEDVQITKAERLAKHAESNKKIWQSAEEPSQFHFLAARDTIPLKQEFKPALKVLSRKPAPKLIKDPITGMEKLTVEDDNDETVRTAQLTPEEARLKSQKEREDKQRKYDEARARIMGNSSGGSTPRSGTPTEESKQNKGKGRGRGDARPDTRRPDSQSGNKELFDPNYTPKPGVIFQKRNGDGLRPGKSSSKEDDRIIRPPRGPDINGRGFGTRGGKMS